MLVICDLAGSMRKAGKKAEQGRIDRTRSLNGHNVGGLWNHDEDAALDCAREAVSHSRRSARVMLAD